MNLIRGSAAALLLTASFSTWAQEVEFLGVDIRGIHRFTAGAAMRTQDRDASIIGKTNLPGQTDLCVPDDCVSSMGDPGPNQRFVDAAGFYSVNADNGNLNYDKHDLVSATSKLTSEFNVDFGYYGNIFVRTTAFYDAVNTNFDESHPNTLFQPARTPRSAAIEREAGTDFDLLDAFTTLYLPVPGTQRELTLRAGQFVSNWGESTFLVPNSLNHINPPNVQKLRIPGSDPEEVFTPIPLVSVTTDIVDGLTFEGIYHLDWEPVVPDQMGTFFSTSDIAGGGEYAMLSFGKAPEDPERLSTPAGLTGLLSQSSRTVPRIADVTPGADGQYGISLRYFADWLGAGTELAFYHANYHSRFPIASFVAADASSCRDDVSGIPIPPLPLPGAGDAGPALACTGLADDPAAALAAVAEFAGGGTPSFPGEALPVDTARLFLEYPEDIRLWGFSFNTLIGDIALQGEYAFRDNLPVQVHQADLVFASLQQAFPEEDVDLLGLATIPGNRNAVPDFVATRFRNQDVQPGDLIRGFERLKVGQLNLGGTVTFGGSNPFNANQILGIYEFGAVHVMDMPDLSQIQFNGPGADTHFSPGADGTGAPDGMADARRQNPTRQVDGFATRFSWGYRLIGLFRFQNALFGANIEPLVGVFHDVKGYSPGPGGLFVEGRKQFIGGIRFDYLNKYTGELRHTWYTGGSEHNQLRDRDFLQLSVAINF